MSHHKSDSSKLRTVFVQETSGNWAGLLRRQLPGEDIVVVRVETIDELSKQLEGSPESCFVVPISTDAAGLEAACTNPIVPSLPNFDALKWIIDAKTRFPHAKFCGVSNGPVVAWPAGEAGASLVIDHPLEIGRLARFVRRHIAARLECQIDSESPVAGTENLVESLWLTLPWADHATPTTYE